MALLAEEVDVSAVLGVVPVVLIFFQISFLGMELFLL
jgi:hypothetical protein